MKDEADRGERPSWGLFGHFAALVSVVTQDDSGCFGTIQDDSRSRHAAIGPGGLSIFGNRMQYRTMCSWQDWVGFRTPVKDSEGTR